MEDYRHSGHKDVMGKIKRHSREWGRYPQLVSYLFCVILHAVQITTISGLALTRTVKENYKKFLLKTWKES